MNDFQDMIKEAFVGEEPYRGGQDSTELRASIRKFEVQDRLLRIGLWGSVLAMSALCYWSGLRFWQAPQDASPKQLILYATLFLVSIQCIGWTKMFLFNNQKSFSILKELKRVQLLLLEER